MSFPGEYLQEVIGSENVRRPPRIRFAENKSGIGKILQLSEVHLTRFYGNIDPLVVAVDLRSSTTSAVLLLSYSHFPGDEFSG
jgi:hypothetical protein